MRKRISLDETKIANRQPVKSRAKSSAIYTGIPEISPFRDILAGEGSEDLLNYIEWLGLGNDPNPVVLSSMHHYYYDAEEMKNVRTVVNLIRLNHIKEIKSFLYSVSHILSSKCNLIGCFIDTKKHNPFVLQNNVSGSESKRISTALENGIMSKIPFLNRIYSIFDSRTNKYLAKNEVTVLLEDHGFKVLDMTDLNGITYFHAKRKPKNAGSH